MVRPAEAPVAPPSPTRVFVLVLLVVFAAESAIMLLLPQLPDAWHGSLLDVVVDAGALTVLTAPAIWLLVVSPLRQLFDVRGLLLRRLFESQEQERARVARDLHDGLGQDLTALLVGLRTIEEAGDADTARARARELRELAASAHGEVRRLARGLRPLVLEELGLVAALERLCEEFERTCGVATTLACEGEPIERLEPVAEAALYRIVQEALGNVARHAGAREARVVVRRGADALALSIADDGHGFDPDRPPASSDGGFGLASVRERARLLGGTCEVRSRAGAGTTLEIRIPLP